MTNPTRPEDEETIIEKGSPVPEHEKIIVEQFAQYWPDRFIQNLETFGKWLLSLLTLFSSFLIVGFGVLRLQTSGWLYASTIFIVGSVALVVLGMTPPRGRDVDPHDAEDIQKFYSELINKKGLCLRFAGILFALGIFLIVPAIAISPKNAPVIATPQASLALRYMASAEENGILDVSLRLEQLRDKSRVKVNLVGYPTKTFDGKGVTLFKQFTDAPGDETLTLSLQEVEVANLKSFRLEVNLFESDKLYYHKEATLTLPPKRASEQP